MTDPTTTATAEQETETVRVLVTETTSVYYDIPVKKGTSDSDVRAHVAMLDREELDKLPNEVNDAGCDWSVEVTDRNPDE